MDIKEMCKIASAAIVKQAGGSIDIQNKAEQWNARTGFNTNTYLRDVVDSPINRTITKVISPLVESTLGLTLRKNYDPVGFHTQIPDPTKIDMYMRYMGKFQQHPSDRTKTWQGEALKEQYAQAWGIPTKSNPYRVPADTSGGW